MALAVRAEVLPRDREVLARMVSGGEGVGTKKIARRTWASKPTVILWKKRYAADGADGADGVGGLEDRPKPGKPRTVDDVAIVLATLRQPPSGWGNALVVPAAGHRIELTRP